jgi:hypothetical protein
MHEHLNKLTQDHDWPHARMRTCGCHANSLLIRYNETDEILKTARSLMANAVSVLEWLVMMLRGPLSAVVERVCIVLSLRGSMLSGSLRSRYGGRRYLNKKIKKIERCELLLLVRDHRASDGKRTKANDRLHQFRRQMVLDRWRFTLKLAAHANSSQQELEYIEVWSSTFYESWIQHIETCPCQLTFQNLSKPVKTCQNLPKESQVGLLGMYVL